MGIYFETDFNSEQMIVMKIKPNSYAASNTSIKVGDALVAVNDVVTEGLSFDEIMKNVRVS